MVDFTQPYIESGLVVVASVKKTDSNAWAFFTPFTPMMWTVTAVFFLGNGVYLVGNLALSVLGLFLFCLVWCWVFVYKVLNCGHSCGLQTPKNFHIVVESRLRTDF